MYNYYRTQTDVCLPDSRTRSISLGLGERERPPFQLQLTIGRVLSTQKGECQQSKVSVNIEHLLVQLLVHCWPEKFGKHWTHHWFMLLLHVAVCQCSHISNLFLWNLSWVQNRICRTSYCKTVCDEMCVCLTVCVCVTVCVWLCVCVCVITCNDIKQTSEKTLGRQRAIDWFRPCAAIVGRGVCLAGLCFIQCKTLCFTFCRVAFVPLWRSCTRYLSTMSRADGAACLKYPQNM